MYLKIPVSRLSKKILLAEYPSDEKYNTIKVSSHSLLYRQLHTINEKSTKQKIDILNSEIYVIVSRRLRYNESQLCIIGRLIHQEHRLSIMRWIQATVDAGITPTHGINTFFARYDLEDDDMNRETVYRMWQRYISTTVEIQTTSKDRILTPIRTKENIDLVIDQDKIAHFVAENIEVFYKDYRDIFNKSMLRNLKLMLLSEQSTFQYVSDIEKMPMSTLSNRVYKIKRFIGQDPRLCTSFTKIFGAPLYHYDQRSNQHKVVM